MTELNEAGKLILAAQKIADLERENDQLRARVKELEEGLERFSDSIGAIAASLSSPSELVA